MSAATVDSLSLGKKATKPFTILIVEDDPTDVELLLHAIEKARIKAVEGEIELQVRATAEGALKALNEESIDLVITDMILPGIDGLDLISRIQDIDRNLPVLMLTRMGGVPSAVEAMRRGAYDYILKPVTPDDLGSRLHRAIRISEIIRRNSVLERLVQQDLQAGSLVGISPAFQDIMRKIREASQVRSTVLITGETGTGKGLIARAIHEHSREHEMPYQIIDCTTVPEGMIESELFGHVRGAFTGAVSNKPGLIELADGGSVFLDEIGELPLALQAKLLHVLEENEVRPVGGTRTKRVDMRFIAATNQDLEEKVRIGSFRKDLYFRLAVVVIKVPPLRERIEDVPVIARHLLSQFGREMGKPHCYLEPEAMNELTAYRWPGNVRELRNVLERVMMLATEDVLTAEDIKSLLPVTKSRRPGLGGSPLASLPYMQAKRQVLSEFTRAYLREKLAMHRGHITRAAEDSGIPRQHFSLLVKRFLKAGEVRDLED
jgi:DNA-binding NtrC family response regulator